MREAALSLLRYEPDTGLFFWRDDAPAKGARKPGARAGYVVSHGYREIKVMGRAILEHRIAWLFTHGVWPTKDIDHKDGGRANNRVGNLRLCTDSQNGGNQRIAKNNTSGFKGVYAKGGRYCAKVRVNYRLLNLGSFATKEEAAAVAQAARVKHFGEFARAA